MISISHHQRSPLNQANWVGTIHHGLPLDLYQPVERRDDGSSGYLAFLGRLSRDKRPDRAIEIARRSGLKLRIAAKVGEDDRAYFHDTIEPLIDGSRHRVYRRDRRGREGGVPRQCRGTAVPDRLAGAVRPRGDRSDGLRHARHRLGQRRHAGDRRRRRSPASSCARSAKQSTRSSACPNSTAISCGWFSSGAFRQPAWSMNMPRSTRARSTQRPARVWSARWQRS